VWPTVSRSAYLQQPLGFAFAHLVLVDTFKLGEQARLFIPRQHSFRHHKEDPVLLCDVFA
jgi:hypothetical protein